MQPYQQMVETSKTLLSISRTYSLSFRFLPMKSQAIFARFENNFWGFCAPFTPLILRDNYLFNYPLQNRAKNRIGSAFLLLY